MKRTIEEIAASGIITELEIRAIKRKLNQGAKCSELLEPIYRIGGVSVTHDQFAKAVKWMMNLRHTPAGKERKNNPFRAREEYTIDNTDDIALIDFFDAGNWSRNMVPVYRVSTNNGTSFDYYFNAGICSIIG